MRKILTMKLPDIEPRPKPEGQSKAAEMKRKNQDALNMMKGLSGKPEKEEEQ